jgi:lysozyme family protein
MTRLAIRLAAALAAAATLVGISTTSAFARVLLPESSGVMLKSADGTSAATTTTVVQASANPVPWLVTGALVALVGVGLYQLASALVRRTRTPSVG